MTMPFEEARAKVEEALGKGDVQAAFAGLRMQLAWPGTLAAPEQWEEALDLFARVADKMGDAALGSLLRDTSRTYNDPNALYDLGYQLLERGLADIGATVLARTNALAPGRPKVLGELAYSLGGIGQDEEVVRLLRKVPELTERDFVLSYLLSFHAIMTRDMDEARRRLPKLLAEARSPKSSEFPAMAKAIEGMLARADAVRHATPLDEDDLRGWQFVVNGQFLLHLSPHGEEVMRGRYAFLQDTPALCHEGIRRLAALFEALDVRPPRVFFLPNRASEALGRAAAKDLGVCSRPCGRTSPAGSSGPRRDPGPRAARSPKTASRSCTRSARPPGTDSSAWTRAPTRRTRRNPPTAPPSSSPRGSSTRRRTPTRSRTCRS